MGTTSGSSRRVNNCTPQTRSDREAKHLRVDEAFIKHHFRTHCVACVCMQPKQGFLGIVQSMALEGHDLSVVNSIWNATHEMGLLQYTHKRGRLQLSCFVQTLSSRIWALVGSH